MNVSVVTLEERVVANVHMHVHVPRGAALRPNIALTRQSQVHTRVDACRITSVHTDRRVRPRGVGKATT